MLVDFASSNLAIGLSSPAPTWPSVYPRQLQPGHRFILAYSNLAIGLSSRTIRLTFWLSHTVMLLTPKVSGVKE
jgi:hypothetical protein